MGVLKESIYFVVILGCEVGNWCMSLIFIVVFLKICLVFLVELCGGLIFMGKGVSCWRGVEDVEWWG